MERNDRTSLKFEKIAKLKISEPGHKFRRLIKIMKTHELDLK